VAAAERCRDALGLDRVLLVVANDPWQKTPERTISPPADRLAMVQAAVEGLERIEASAMEIERGGPSYTIDTVEELQRVASSRRRPDPECFVIIGADLAATLHTWRRSDELRRRAALAVVSRPRAPRHPVLPGWRVTEVPGVEIDVSSSQIRQALAEGRPIDAMVPPGVIRCIHSRDLYSLGR
jgi:nicotinate-nucleotide adenylyltransferase